MSSGYDSDHYANDLPPSPLTPPTPVNSDDETYDPYIFEDDNSYHNSSDSSERDEREAREFARRRRSNRKYWIDEEDSQSITPPLTPTRWGFYSVPLDDSDTIARLKREVALEVQTWKEKSFVENLVDIKDKEDDIASDPSMDEDATEAASPINANNDSPKANSNSIAFHPRFGFLFPQPQLPKE